MQADNCLAALGSCCCHGSQAQTQEESWEELPHDMQVQCFVWVWKSVMAGVPVRIHKAAPECMDSMWFLCRWSLAAENWVPQVCGAWCAKGLQGEWRPFHKLC